MKYYLVLIANCLLLFFITSYFIDHPILRTGKGPALKNLFLLLLLALVAYNVFSIYIAKKSTPETGVVYKLAAVSYQQAVAFNGFTKPFRKELVLYSLVAGALVMGGLLLVGLPGQLLLEAPARMGIWKALQGDKVWPAAILLSILCPLCLPAGVLLKHYLINRGHTGVSFAAIVLTLALGIPFLTGLVYALSKN